MYNDKAQSKLSHVLYLQLTSNFRVNVCKIGPDGLINILN